MDKTPRYYFIIEEIIELFPDAKFIFLFRNPLHIYASIINTWGKNRFNKQYKNYQDIITGFEMLSNGFLKHKDKSIFINYEELVIDPKKSLSVLSKYLDLEINFDALKEFKNQNLKGNLGDPTGIKLYKKITPEGLIKWKTTFNSFLRKKEAIKLLSKINEKSFQIQKYDKWDIIEEVKTINNSKNKVFIKDLFDITLSSIIGKYNLYLLNKNYKWLRNKHIS